MRIRRVSLTALLIAQLAAPPARAGGPSDIANNSPVERPECAKSLDPAARPYPFSVSRIQRVIEKIDPTPRVGVGVAVVDNGFLGYRLNTLDSEDEPERLPTRNFPKVFFSSKAKRSFTPYLDPNAMLPPPDPDLKGAELARYSHGTHVAGIILGGMYDDEKAPDEADERNLQQPNVRRLMVHRVGGDDDAPAYRDSWVKLTFVRVDADSDPVVALTNFAGAFKGRIEIFNMSLARVYTSAPPVIELPSNTKNALIVASAGNLKLDLSTNSLRAIPTILPDEGRLLVVASHEPDGALSPFSNWGLPVTIAAPGCAIRSWFNGASDARPLSGTSMAAAVVSFAAALLRSRWDMRAVGLRNRLLASARYEPQLVDCEIRRLTSTSATAKPVACVQHGALLDIEAALLTGVDLMDYETCAPGDTKACEVRTVLGDLQKVPGWVEGCTQGLRDGVKYQGITLNGALKRTTGGRYILAYEPGDEVGQLSTAWADCEPSSEQGVGEVIFIPRGEQLDGRAPSIGGSSVILPTTRVLRIVTRVAGDS